MPPGSGAVVIRALAVVPVILLVLYAGVLGLLGLLCGRERRKYVVSLSRQAMGTAGMLMHGPAALSSRPGPRSDSRTSRSTT
jgi:hypothetical protein